MPALPDVRFVQPKQDAQVHQAANVLFTQTGQGSRSSEGDVTHLAYAARAAFGTNGSGVKIGVLSDGVTSLATNPSLSGESRALVTSFAGVGGERYDVSFGADTKGAITLLQGVSENDPGETTASMDLAMIECAIGNAQAATMASATWVAKVSYCASNLRLGLIPNTRKPSGLPSQAPTNSSTTAQRADV